MNEDFYDEIYMEIIQLISVNYDSTLDRASNVAEQITTYVRDMVEEEISNAE